jgi:cation transport ATPase
MSNPSAHDTHQEHVMPASGEINRAIHYAHARHGGDHSGHEQLFPVRFWGRLLLSIPVLLCSGMIQMWLGFTLAAFPFSEWIPFVFSVIIFGYGGVPLLQMAIPELRGRKPGMMTLISLAISVAFSYSVAAQFMALGEGFFWELVTPIDIRLLGHWLEMRSVRQASGALSELAKLMPDTAERIHQGDLTEIVTILSSIGRRITSRTRVSNSGNSSRNRTPQYAKEISPGLGILLRQPDQHVKLCGVARGTDDILLRYMKKGIGSLPHGNVRGVR